MHMYSTTGTYETYKKRNRTILYLDQPGNNLLSKFCIAENRRFGESGMKYIAFRIANTATGGVYILKLV